jgi:hypothetical protein
MKGPSPPQATSPPHQSRRRHQHPRAPSSPSAPLPWFSVAQAADPLAPRFHLFPTQLHQRTFGTDVLQCPCEGRRTVRASYATHKQAEARLMQLGVPLPSRAWPLAPAVPARAHQRALPCLPPPAAAPAPLPSLLEADRCCNVSLACKVGRWPLCARWSICARLELRAKLLGAKEMKEMRSAKACRV